MKQTQKIVIKNSLNIKALAQRAHQGDKTAEEDLFSILSLRFRAIAKYRVGIDDYRDLAQDACVTVMEKYRTLDNIDNFEAWAYQILRNKIGNFYQKQAIKNHTIVNASELQNFIADSRSSHYLMLKQRIRHCLKQIFKSNKRYFEILKLVHEGYSTKEICESLKIKPGNLYFMLSISRKTLRVCLNKRGYSDK